MQDNVKLIVEAVPAQKPMRDRLGARTHGVIPNMKANATLDIPSEQFATQLANVIEVANAVAGRLKAQIAEYSADEITIGLAVSGEGSIGVATIGVQASIHVTLKRR